jgi:hypothetical protein
VEEGARAAGAAALGRAVPRLEARVKRWLWALLLVSDLAFAGGFDQSHAAWTALLKKHVVVLEAGKASQVRYAEFAKDRAALKACLDSLSGVQEAEFRAWSRPQRMAFLINAYNAFTIELILAHYPVGSIKDVGNDLFDNRWKKKFFKLLGPAASLDQIEHEMLRKPGVYDEPRVHFALNCASVGCPMLREEAFVADRLEVQLEEQAKRFLSDRSRNRYANGRLEVSKIFDWFKEDFAPREKFFERYAAQLGGTSALVSFLDYDWTLNDFPSSSRR